MDTILGLGMVWLIAANEVWATECDDVAFFFWGDDVARHTWRSAYIAYVPFFFFQRQNIFVTQKRICSVSVEQKRADFARTRHDLNRPNWTTVILSEKPNVPPDMTQKSKPSSGWIVRPQIYIWAGRERGGLGKLWFPSTSGKLRLSALVVI